MNYEISFHPDVYKEFMALDGSQKILVAKQIQKAQAAPLLSEMLGNKKNMDLSKYRKMYADKKKIRIIYSIHKEIIEIYILAIGARDELRVYKDAFSRKK